MCTSRWPEHLFLARCSSWLLFNWISSSRSQACHRSQGLLSLTTGLPLSGRFRAKLITCLPLWLIAGMFSGVTYHAGSLGRVFFVCTSGWNWFCFPLSQSCMEKTGLTVWLCEALPMPRLTRVKRAVYQTQSPLCSFYMNSMIRNDPLSLFFIHSEKQTKRKYRSGAVCRNSVTFRIKL